MATIVEHIPSGHRYLLIGAGFGAYRSSRPNVIFGSLLPTVDEGTQDVLAVCGLDGQVGWVESSAVRVISVDGQSPQALLGAG